MVYFAINLVKDSVIPRARRRLFRWTLFAYFLGCGAAMVVVCYRGAQALVTLRGEQERVERMERPLLGLTASARDVPQHVKAMCGDLERTGAKLAHADEVLGQRILLAPILLGLVLPLPEDSTLASLEVDRQTGLVRFDLIMSINFTNQMTHSSFLMAAWANDLHLAKRVQNIRLVTTQQKTVRGCKVFVAHFEGALRQKG